MSVSVLADSQTIDWLMAGDPVIPWQTMRDLLDRPEKEWEAERQKITKTGWGAEFLSHQRPDGTWPLGRWTDTTWTLLLLMDAGIPKEIPSISEAVERTICKWLPKEGPSDPRILLSRVDVCHLGFWLRFGSYFLGEDRRMAGLAHTLMTVQFPDGGWNCRKRNHPETHHSSFHTTFNVLDGLRAARDSRLLGSIHFRIIEAQAMGFMLAHQMYRSDKTGHVIDEKFTHLAYPSHWRYIVLRGLDYMRSTPEIRDD
ncbi:MAG: hypothetical protein EOP84_10830, partial [Verrucomicrobiaceae bacterium]